MDPRRKSVSTVPVIAIAGSTARPGSIRDTTQYICSALAAVPSDPLHLCGRVEPATFQEDKDAMR